MGWLRNKIRTAAVRSQSQEIDNFLLRLRGMDPDELALLAALASHARHTLVKQGHGVDDPIVYAAKNPELLLLLGDLIRDMQKINQTELAAGMMVWLHTFRAAISQELRVSARAMWGQLARGFPLIDSVATSFSTLKSISLRTDGATRFPLGFSPQE